MENGGELMITNKTRNSIISKNEIVCASLSSQARGLMFRCRQNLVMVFPEERIISLHNFCVFFPIDILVLNKNKKIVEIKRHFLPFTFWKSQTKGKYVLEFSFPEKYEVGDQLELNLNSLSNKL